MTIGTSAVQLQYNPVLASRSVGSAGTSGATQPAAREDSVQLSATAQRAVATAQTAAAVQTTQPTLDTIIRQAASGDIRAIAQLALV